MVHSGDNFGTVYFILYYLPIAHYHCQIRRANTGRRAVSQLSNSDFLLNDIVEVLSELASLFWQHPCAAFRQHMENRMPHPPGATDPRVLEHLRLVARDAQVARDLLPCI